MNKENTEKLFKYPFFHPEKSEMESLLCFGFECNDGWFSILLDLCEKIMATKPPSNYEVIQVKEKMSMLCWYDENDTDEIRKLVKEAEEKSTITCEICGAEGTRQHRNSWLKTLCSLCGERLGYKNVHL